MQIRMQGSFWIQKLEVEKCSPSFPS